jgi:hypothetical protein
LVVTLPERNPGADSSEHSLHDPERLESLIQRFVVVGKDFVQKGRGAFSGDPSVGWQPLVLEIFGEDRASGSNDCVVIGLMIHGNEYGPLDSVVPWLEGLALDSAALDSRSRGGSSQEQERSLPHVLVFLANVAAGMNGRRFLDSDLNRLFAPKTPGQIHEQSHESGLAAALKPHLDRPDLALFVDLHQTIEPTDRAFFIFGFHAPSFEWACRLAPGVTDTLVTRAPGQAFVVGQMAADEYVRSRGIPAVTVELGQRGFSQRNTVLTDALLSNLCKVVGSGPLKENISKRIDQVGNAAPDLGARQAPAFQTVLKTVARIPFAGSMARLRDGLQNFGLVRQDEILGDDGQGNAIRCPCDGFLLFPKYPNRDAVGQVTGPLPADIATVVDRVDDLEFQAWQNASQNQGSASI